MAHNKVHKNMEQTKKVQRKVSLSLQKKRQSASPKQCVVSVDNVSEVNCAAAEPLPAHDIIVPPSSPSVHSISSDCSTPPHRQRFSLDESMEASPRLMDTSFSPSSLFSQTMNADSPDVNWHWNGKSVKQTDNLNDSGCNFVERRTTSGRERRRLLLSGYDNRRRVQEQELRRAQQLQADELLRERCEKLQKQFKLEMQVKSVEKEKPTATAITTTTTTTTIKQSMQQVAIDASQQVVEATALPSKKVDYNANTTINTESNDPLNDFLNDSDSDSFLLAATQQFETENTTTATPDKITTLLKPATCTTPTTSLASVSRNESRSSFYMKFLEDEMPDEWFSTLDEAVLEATQSKKPRTSLQRYKSMPTTITTTATVASSATLTIASSLEPSCNVSNSNYKNYNHHVATSTAPTGNGICMKRHASSHALSPVARGKIFGQRLHK